MSDTKKWGWRGAAGFLFRLALGIAFISPLIVGLCFSFQDEQTLGMYPLKLLVSNPTLENYGKVFTDIPRDIPKPVPIRSSWIWRTR